LTGGHSFAGGVVITDMFYYLMVLNMYG